jgi:outer membrane protein assembly factor BamB
VLADGELPVKNALAVLLLAACQGPPDGFANRCVEGWPAAAPVTLAPPLGGVAAGTVKWGTVISGSTAADGLALSGDRIVVGAGATTFFLDPATGAVAARRSSRSFDRQAAPVVGPDGTIYTAGLSVAAMDTTGEYLWMTPLARGAITPNAGRHLLLSPDGVLFFTAGDGWLRAWSTETGQELWKREIGNSALGAATILAGVGNAVMVIRRHVDGEATTLHDTRTGLPLATWPGSPARHGALLGREIGIVTRKMLPTDGPYPWMEIGVLDPCSRDKWTLPASRPQWPVLLGQDDELYVVERDDVPGSDTYVSVYGADGTRKLGPVHAAPPWVLGADGTVYGLSCDSGHPESPSRLHAYDPAFNELWRIELGDICPNGSAIIAPDGTLYFTQFAPSHTDVVAVQTASPGMLPSSWPTRRLNARATGWLE